ncbi:uncharacterized protein [Coffea arabica]|uniref:Uncharacterized protein isoform X1 n=1 Tax=Coffea arabica TaxID=13443 RepID=A0A6P6UWJ3_COFAR
MTFPTMRAVGGPLLCIGDLLSDVGEGDQQAVSGGGSHHPQNLQPLDSDPSLVPSDLPKLFQENYDQLDKALAGTDQSWTALTLKLCTALETGNKVVEFASSHIGLLSEMVEKLERITKQRDSAIEAAKAIQGFLEQNEVFPRENSFAQSDT